MRMLGRVLAVCLFITSFAPIVLAQTGIDVEEVGYRNNATGVGLENRRPVNKHIDVVASIDFGQRVSDVWVHGNHAYVGGFRSSPTDPPADVKIVDVSDPTSPQVVASLSAIFPTSSPQDVKVASLDTPAFNGDLLVVANEGGGYQLFDVTQPASPVLLFQETLSIPGCCVTSPHNSYIFQQGAAAFMFLAVDFNELNRQFYNETPEGDLLIYDITDPTNPVKIANWGISKDLGLGLDPYFGCAECRGDFASSFLHDVWVSEDGQTAYLSYWDAGLVILDVSDPHNPTFIGRGVEPPAFGGDEGNAHNAVPANGGNLVLVGDEDFVSRPFGFVRVFDTSDPTNPTQVGTFAIGEALSPKHGNWSVHNIFVEDNLAYISWYWGGIRVVDFSHPMAPVEMAAWAPEQGSIWGVYVQNGLVYASDMIGRLHILRVKKSNSVNAMSGDVATAREAPANGRVSFTSIHPTPFNPLTTIRFNVAQEGHVRLAVYNTAGRAVGVLVDGHRSAGEHAVDFRAGGLPSGIYFAKLESGAESRVRQMVLVK